MSILPDIPRTFTALAEWLACLVLVSGQSKRLSRPLFWGVAMGWLEVQAAFLQLTGSVPLGWWHPDYPRRGQLVLSAAAHAAAAGLSRKASHPSGISPQLPHQISCVISGPSKGVY